MNAAGGWFVTLGRKFLLAALVLCAGSGLAPAQPVAVPAAGVSGPFINILTAGPGGVYYLLGGTLSNVLAAKLPGTKPSVQATKGSVENLNLLQQGKGEIAFTLGNTLASAWSGQADAGFKSKLDKLRGVAAIYPAYVQIVATKESGIRTLADLRGKRVAVNAVGSGTELNARVLLSAAGIGYKDLGKVLYLSYEQSMDLMWKRQLDATLAVTGLGTPALREFANSNPITVIAVPTEIIAKAGVPFAKGVIPKGTYKGQDSDVPTATILNYLVTRADVADDLVYDVTKVVFESTRQLAAAHPAAAGIKIEQALDGMPVPLHPGARKYFKEVGMLK
jgi:TRAP transporter TAXI family solute receptor